MGFEIKPMTDEEKFQTIGNVINIWGSPREFKVALKPFLKLNPHKKIKLLFYSPNKVSYLPLKISEFRPQGRYYLLRLMDKAPLINLDVLKKSDLYSLVANNEFLNENWWKGYQVVVAEQRYQIHQIWNNGYYDLAAIDYRGQGQWIPLIGNYIDFINHDRKLIYLNKVGVLNEI